MDATTIPLDDPEVMSLFHSTDILGITPEDIGGIEMGSLGVPEFGTEFVMQMLKDTNPKCFSDLVRISGLSHGTDVWLGNAQTLIEEGKAEISTAICCRDDIMTYLINMGLDKEQSFTIMESVRKGKGLKPEWEEEMTSHGVPDWYIWSCKKIKFMCIIAAPEGLEKLHKAHPDVQIYVGHLDRQLNEQAYICPGLGDAGDRIFGTK